MALALKLADRELAEPDPAVESMVKRLLKKGMKEGQARALAKKAIAKKRRHMTEDDGEREYGHLTMAQRRALPKSSFVFPSKAPKVGAYPIHNKSHAVAALHYSHGKPEYVQVKLAVCKKFPMLPICGRQMSEDEERDYIASILARR